LILNYRVELKHEKTLCEHGWRGDKILVWHASEASVPEKYFIISLRSGRRSTHLCSSSQETANFLLECDDMLHYPTQAPFSFPDSATQI